MSAQGSLETQELINGLLIDLYSSTRGLEDAMAVEEQMVLSPDMAIRANHAASNQYD